MFFSIETRCAKDSEERLFAGKFLVSSFLIALFPKFVILSLRSSKELKERVDSSFFAEFKFAFSVESPANCVEVPVSNRQEIKL